MKIPANYRRLAFLFVVASFLAACQTAAPQVSPTSAFPDMTTTAPEDATPSPTATQTPIPEPLAASVNGRPVSLARYEAELQQYQAAAAELGLAPEAEESRQQVLDALIQEQLLAQAAEANGYQASSAEIEARAAQLAAGMGEGAFETWLSELKFERKSFEQSLALSLAASWQRDQILAGVPEEIEQVHARQLLVLSASEAEGLYRQLQAGASFDNLILRYDPLTGGDLGWFPRGYLTQPAVEEAAFALQPGEHSQVIQTEFGYHVIEVIERGVAALSPDARQVLQRAALAEWLAEQRASSQIEILLP